MKTTALFCNFSPAFPDLFRSGQVSVDGLEFTPFHRPSDIRSIQAVFPSLAYQFHAGNVGRLSWSVSRLLRYHNLCSQSRFISLHLSPVPAWIVWSALRLGIHFPVPDSETLIERYILNMRRLKTQVTLPVILENMGVLPGLDSFFESDPETIHRVLKAVDCGFLLDLGHARIAAGYRHITPQAYLEALPLKKVAQIHISGPRRRGEHLFDAHEALLDEDYGLLDWVLARTAPKILTLEYYRDQPSPLREMLMRLREVLDQHNLKDPKEGEK
jgi:uncharacterized protein (UPF0276 family)